MATATLEVNEDQQFESRENVATKFAWLVLGVIILLGLAGLLGRGPLSSAKLTHESLTLEYHKFLRKGASAEFVIRSESPNVSEHRVWLNNKFLENVEIDRIEPEPIASVAKDEGVEYRFAASAGATPDIAFHFEPQTWGKIPAQFSNGNGTKTDLNLFVYP